MRTSVGGLSDVECEKFHGRNLTIAARNSRRLIESMMTILAGWRALLSEIASSDGSDDERRRRWLEGVAPLLRAAHEIQHATERRRACFALYVVAQSLRGEAGGAWLLHDVLALTRLLSGSLPS